MADPGLPPKHHSLNLLESLVQEEEDRVRGQGHGSVLLPVINSDSSFSISPETTLDSQQPHSEVNATAGSLKEFKMKDIKENAKVKKTKLNAGFKGKKMTKRRSRSNSPEPDKGNRKQKFRPFSADYKYDQREKIRSRPATSKTAYHRSSSSSLDDSGKRDEKRDSVDSYSSDTYSSDEEYVKKEKYRSTANTVGLEPQQFQQDDFFDADASVNREDSFFGVDENNKYNDNHGNNSPRQERSRSSDNSDVDRSKPSTSKAKTSGPQLKSSMKKTVHINENVQQRTRSLSENSDNEKMVVDDDYSSFSSSSDDESHSQRSDNKTSKKGKVAQTGKTQKPKNKKLLNRKKVPNFKTFQVTPDQVMEAKVQQKYMELEELMSCQIVDQKSTMTRHHMYQMELLRNQYKSVSHGMAHSSVIIPRSLPAEVRTKSQRPLSGRRSNKHDSDQDSSFHSVDHAYGTIRSVMAAEHARKTDTIRTDIVANRPPSAKRKVTKRKLEASLKPKSGAPTTSKERPKSESEDEPSERPSIASSARTDSSREPNVTNTKPSIDHHVKYSKNDRLKQWLKEKNRIYRKQIKQEKTKKREERDKLINDANDRIEKHFESQKLVKKWMQEKNKELFQKQKEENRRLKQEEEERSRRVVKLPGDTIRIRPQSAPPVGRVDDIKIDKDKLKGGQTPQYVKDQIREKRSIEEENRQAKLARDGGAHPPQAKFIYKRPVAGKIKFAMKDQGKAPESVQADAGGEQLQLQGVRMSYDDWLVKKRHNDVNKSKEREDERKKEMAKSDPELNRIIPHLAKKRVEQKLNQRKRIDTGIKSHDDKANKSFGGGDFDGGSGKGKVSDRPRSAYRLESDRKSADGPALTVKQMKRPQTAPSGREKPPHPKPKKSVNSPRQAVIPAKPEQIMANNDETNPFRIPFPPEKGAPKHVAARQRKIFADQINERLGEMEREAARNVGITDDVGVNDNVETGGNLQLDDIESKMESENKDEQENAEAEKKVLITEIMYSPKRVEDSSSESSEEPIPTKIDAQIQQIADEQVTENIGAEHGKVSDSKEYEMQKEDVDAYIEDIIHENISWKSKTVDNLHQVHDGVPNADKNTDDLKLDIEKLKEKVESLKMDPPLIDRMSLKTAGNIANENLETHTGYENNSRLEYMGPPLVGILKESKITDINDELEDKGPEAFNQNNDDSNEEISEELDMISPREDSPSPNAKHVSFIEEVEVFESYESSSTETLTPEQPNSVDASTYGLDSQPDFDGIKFDSCTSVKMIGRRKNEEEIHVAEDIDDPIFEGSPNDDTCTSCTINGNGEMGGTSAFITDLGDELSHSI